MKNVRVEFWGILRLRIDRNKGVSRGDLVVIFWEVGVKLRKVASLN